MGVCQSGENVEGTGSWDDEPEFTADANAKRHHANKKTEEVEDYDPADIDRPEDDCFEFEEEEVQEGEQFLAVKPWIGAVVEPDNHPEVNKEKPDTTYTLEYAYGYRC